MSPSSVLLEVAGGKLPPTSPLWRRVEGRGLRAKDAGQLYLGLSLEGATGEGREELLEALRPRSLWGIAGVERPTGQEVEDWVLGKGGLSPEPHQAPPPGLERALWLFGRFFPLPMVEAGYWWALAEDPSTPVRHRPLLAAIALRALEGGKAPLSPGERGKLYKVRHRYRYGLGASPERERPSPRPSFRLVASFYELPVGHFFAHLRKLVGLTQGEVAQRLGVSQERVSLLEGGAGPKVRFRTLKRYVQALGLELVLPGEEPLGNPPLEALLEDYARRGEAPEGVVLRVRDREGKEVASLLWEFQGGDPS